MDMKKIVYAFVCLTGLLTMASCSKETIDSEPVQYAGPEIIYGYNVNITQVVNRLYTYVPGGHNRLGGNSMVASATDEAVHAARGSEAERWGTGLWGTTPSTIRDDDFARTYEGIRATFVYSEEIHPNIIDGVMNQAERDSHLGQALFIRALLNFELLKRYGGYPIVNQALQADESLNIPKSSYDECVKYISDLCDEAQGLLKVSYPAAGDFGRATKGAAMALKARLLLYAASPLNNPNGDLAKWKAAAVAADAVIKTNQYALYTTGAGYSAFFNTLSGNKEIIFSKIEANTNTLERLNGPVSISGGESGTNPTLDLVNAYERIDGTPFDWNNATHAANPFADRDPRFAKSILYNGSTWMNGGATNVIETFEGGEDMNGSKATRTGFYLRKFLNINARWLAPTGVANHSFPLFRYGEVLLNYAEAMNEAFGPDDPGTFGLTARQALAQIRTRAGLTANQTVPSATDKASMREAIRHERRIELAFEEHRHLDLRRWKTAETVLNQPVHGLKIVKNGNGTFTYTPEVVEQRVFQAKMYLYPFPQAEISRNSSLIQNTGW